MPPKPVMMKPIHQRARLMRPWKVVSSCDDARHAGAALLASGIGTVAVRTFGASNEPVVDQRKQKIDEHRHDKSVRGCLF